MAKQTDETEKTVNDDVIVALEAFASEIRCLLDKADDMKLPFVAICLNDAAERCALEIAQARVR